MLGVNKILLPSLLFWHLQVLMLQLHESCIHILDEQNWKGMPMTLNIIMNLCTLHFKNLFAQ
jgi:hypothetical protein